MSIQAEKLKLIQLLLKTESPAIIEKVKAVFQSSSEQNEIWEELSKEQKNEVDKALEESMNDLTVDYDSFMSDYRALTETFDLPKLQSHNSEIYLIT